MLAVLAFLLWFLPADAKLASVEQSLAKGQYRTALDQLADFNSHDARWHLLASEAYDGLNNPAEAVQEAEEALKLEPQQPAFHLQLAQIFLSRNTPQAAWEILRDASAMFPDEFMIRLGKGLAEKELQRYDEAEQSFQWCLARQPASALAFDALATVYLHRSRFRDLRELATGFLKQNAADYRGYYFLAAGQDGELLGADTTLSLLRKTLNQNPSFAAAHALMGKILLREGNTTEAVSFLKRAVALRPDLVQAHLNLARALRLLHDESGSVREFEIVRQLKAKEQEPAPSLHYHRGPR